VTYKDDEVSLGVDGSGDTDSKPLTDAETYALKRWLTTDQWTRYNAASMQLQDIDEHANTLVSL